MIGYKKFRNEKIAAVHTIISQLKYKVIEMKFRNIRKLNMALGLILLLQAGIGLAKPACDDLAFEVIFKDMGYGIGTGAVFTGLYLAAADTNYETGSALANGALLGAGVGIVAGVLELALRECPSNMVETKGWQVPKVIIQPQNGYGLAVRYNL